jgi:hypothetical protein
MLRIIFKRGLTAPNSVKLYIVTVITLFLSTPPVTGKSLMTCVYVTHRNVIIKDWKLVKGNYPKLNPKHIINENGFIQLTSPDKSEQINKSRRFDQKSDTSNFMKKSVYKVEKLMQSIMIDAKWEKAQWRSIKPLRINKYMGEIPSFKPEVKAKLTYDDENVYFIFQVKDRFVRCVTKDTNGNVWEDSCVEFFFAPDPQYPQRYFNLEINCGGTPLMHYNLTPRKEIIKLSIDDIQEIEIAHSLPQIVNPEIQEPITWIIEGRIPFSILRKYANITHPITCTEWRGNFYKIADQTSNPHYISWAPIESAKPDYHSPQFFGIIEFE